jgi:uncharacterized protein YegP (UPF0339 family)
MGKFIISTRKNGEFQFNLRRKRTGYSFQPGIQFQIGCQNGIESVKKILRKILNLKEIPQKTADLF